MKSGEFLKLALCCGVLGVASVANAASVLVYMSGEALTKNCRAFMEVRRTGAVQATQQSWDAGECYGFVVGVIDHFGVMASIGAPQIENIGRFCLAEDVNANDAVEVVARYVDDHPEKRSLGAYFLTRQALAEKFPCP